MYCRKCGKQIDYDADFCNECRNEEILFGDAEKKRKPFPGNAYGLAMAITGAAIGLAAIIMSLGGTIWQYSILYFTYQISMLDASEMMILFGACLLAPAFGLGVASVVRSSVVKARCGKLPKTTWLFGICTVVITAAYAVALFIDQLVLYFAY